MRHCGTCGRGFATLALLDKHKQGHYVTGSDFVTKEEDDSGSGLGAAIIGAAVESIFDSGSSDSGSSSSGSDFGGFDGGSSGGGGAGGDF